MERWRVRFTGRVQGVGFRATTRGLAANHDVTGWVRNEEDGSVVAEVQGLTNEVERFLAAIRERMGRLIRGESAEACPVETSESGFEVRR